MGHDTTVELAADLAAVTALLEIAEELGMSPLLDRAAPFTADEVALAAGIPARSAGEFLTALVAAGIVRPGSAPQQYVPRADLRDLRYECGYLSWAMNANRPYIEHAPEFLRDPDGAGETYDRDGRWVAVSSRWVGSKGFYPPTFTEIVDRKPERIVDFGAGAGRLLIDLLGALPDSSAVAIDKSAAACEEARRAAGRSGVSERLRVVNRTVESLVADPGPLDGADIIHAGFVMHDIVGDAELFGSVLRTCEASLSANGRLVIVDAIPYASDTRERAFSALFTYLHSSSMGVRLPSEAEWTEAFRRAGFKDVSCVPLRMPSSRMFVAGR